MTETAPKYITQAETDAIAKRHNGVRVHLAPKAAIPLHCSQQGNTFYQFTNAVDCVAYIRESGAIAAQRSKQAIREWLARMTAREVPLTIRFTAQEMDLIEFLAEQEDRTKGGMVRRLVDEAITAREQKEKKS